MYLKYNLKETLRLEFLKILIKIKKKLGIEKFNVSRKAACTRECAGD